MARFYTNPKDESDRWKVPDAEVFYMSEEDIAAVQPVGEGEGHEDGYNYHGEGWYVWACFPGCMPDSDPWGPYGTATEAIAEWRDLMGDDDSE